jgi:hypothetical protein
MRVRSASKATSLRTMMTQSSRQREILSLPARPFVLHRLTCLLPLTDFWTKAIAVSSEKTIFTSSGMQQIDPSWTHRLPYYSGYAFFPNMWPRVGLPGGVLRGWPGAGGAPGVRRKVLAGRPVAPSRAPQGHPQEILAQLLGGRGPLGLPGGPNGPKNGLLWLTQAHEISSRRVDRGR